jgi:hypothetical protein
VGKEKTAKNSLFPRLFYATLTTGREVSFCESLTQKRILAGENMLNRPEGVLDQ